MAKAGPAEQLPVAYDGPIGLLVQQQPKLAADPPAPAPPASMLNLVIFTQEHRDAYAMARTLVGRQVRMTGRICQRDGLAAISIETVEPQAPALTLMAPTAQ